MPTWPIGGMEFRSLIYNAAASNNLKRLQVFLNKPRSPEWLERCLNCTQNGSIPLVIAACNGHLEIVKYLVSKGADPNIRGTAFIEGEVIEAAPPLWVASAAGKYDVVEYLVNEAGADINLTTGTNSTPLRSACYDGHLTIVKFLVENGAEIETPNLHGHTPLMIAAFKGKTEVVRYLLEKGAVLSKRSCKGNTALHDAAEGDHPDVCEVLLSYGAQMVEDEFGLCPLIGSALLGNEGVIPILLKYCKSNILKRDALKLLGSTRCDKKMDIQGAVSSWREAVSIPLTCEEEMELLKSNRSYVVHKVYECDSEIESVADIDEIDGQPDAIYMQSLVIRERVVGPRHTDVHYYLRYRGAIYCDTSRVQRCFQLWFHALNLQQLYLPPLHIHTVATFQAFQETYVLALNEQANRIDQGGWSVKPENVGQIYHKVCFELERAYNQTGPPTRQPCDMRDEHDSKKEKDDLVLVALHLLLLLYRLSLPRYQPLGGGGSTTFIDVGRLVLICSRLRLLPLHLALTETEGPEYAQFPSNFVVKLLVRAHTDLTARNSDGNTPLHLLLLHLKPRESIVRMLLSAGAPILARNNDDNTCLDLIELSRLKSVRSGKYITLAGLAANSVMRYICGLNRTEEEVEKFLGAENLIPADIRSFVKMH